MAKAEAAQQAAGWPTGGKPGMPGMGMDGMPPFPTSRPVGESDAAWWLRLGKSLAYNLIKHGGVVAIALIAKKLYLWYSVAEGASDATMAAAGAQAVPTPSWTTLQTEL